jgi:hypothetical protein
MNRPTKRIPGWVYATAFLGGSLLASHQAPTPGPIPPNPDPANEFIVFVTDNDNRTPDQAAILLDDGLEQWLAAKKIGWRIIDKGGQAFTDDGYDKQLAADHVTPPAVVLWNADKSVHRSASLPGSVAAVEEWIAGKVHEPPYLLVGGHKRYLTCLPPSHAKLMAPRGGEFRSVHAPIPRNQWREVNNRSKFPSFEWIYDQNGLGACVGNGSTNALRKARALAGMTDVRLAPGCTYAQINGGRDQGAVISDSLTALQQTGTISSATLGSDEKPFYLRQLPSGWKKEAARFRIEEAYHCSDYDDICTAIQLGYVVVFGIQVGNNFNSFTPEGVPGVSRGPGNHCLCADGLHKLNNGQWALDTVNSWGADWGPWHNGRCYLIESHFQNGDQPDAYAVKTAVEDPLDPIKPPKPKKPVAKNGCRCDACSCSAGECNNPGCLSRLGGKRPDYRWRPYSDTSDEVALYDGDRQVGAYRYSTGQFRPLMDGHWGSSCAPPVQPPVWSLLSGGSPSCTGGSCSLPGRRR